MFAILLFLLIVDSLVLGTVVLLQAGKGGGLAAMGGGASTESFFGGRQATTILTKMSWWCGGLFLGISLILSMMSSRAGGPGSILQGQFETPTPVEAPAAPSTILQDTSGG